MFALSVSQPGATLLMLGARHIETRPWHTAHCGPVAIHAARRLPRNFAALCRQPLVRSALDHAGLSPRDLPRGALLGMMALLDCVRVEDLAELPDAERLLTSFAPGLWAWLLACPSPWPAPRPARGWPAFSRSTCPNDPFPRSFSDEPFSAQPHRASRPRPRRRPAAARAQTPALTPSLSARALTDLYAEVGFARSLLAYALPMAGSS